MPDFNEILEKSLRNIDSSDPQQRKAVYARALSSLESVRNKLDENAFSELRNQLTNSIRQVETRFSDLNAAPTPDTINQTTMSPVDIEHTVDLPQYESGTSAKPMRDVDIVAEDRSASSVPKNDNTMTSQPASGKQSFPGILAGGAVALLFAAAVAWYFLVFANSPLKDGVWRLDLKEWKSVFSSTVDGKTPLDETGNAFEIRGDGEQTTFYVRGRAALYTKQEVPVDLSRDHMLSIRMRVVSLDGNPQLARTLVGLATFDASGNLQDSKPGAHRYGTMVRPVSSDDGWKTYEGRFSGTGDETFNQLREGTATVKPVILLNYDDNANAVTEIEWVELREMPLETK